MLASCTTSVRSRLPAASAGPVSDVRGASAVAGRRRRAVGADLIATRGSDGDGRARDQCRRLAGRTAAGRAGAVDATVVVVAASVAAVVVSGALRRRRRTWLASSWCWLLRRRRRSAAVASSSARRGRHRGLGDRGVSHRSLVGCLTLGANRRTRHQRQQCRGDRDRPPDPKHTHLRVERPRGRAESGAARQPGRGGRSPPWLTWSIREPAPRRRPSRCSSCCSSCSGTP